jgi:energy-coupling factor transporter ATP-binding protein EcfA2
MTEIEKYYARQGTGFWLSEHGLMEEVYEPPEKYELFEDKYGNKKSYNLVANVNNGIYIVGGSGSGKTTTMNTICQHEIERGAKLIYDNYKGPVQRIGFQDQAKTIVSSKFQFDIRLLSEHDWETRTNLQDVYLFDLRRAIKFMFRNNQKITLDSLETALTKKGISKKSRAMILNKLYDLEDEDVLSDEGGTNIIQELKENPVIIIDSSREPEMHQAIIGHISNLIIEGKRTGLMDKREKTILAYDEVGDPVDGVGKLPQVQRVFTMGRIVRVFGLANTQQPQDVHPRIPANCPDKIIHRLNEFNALKRIASITNLDFKLLRATLPYFRPGECLFLRGNIQQVRFVIRK